MLISIELYWGKENHLKLWYHWLKLYYLKIALVAEYAPYTKNGNYQTI